MKKILSALVILLLCRQIIHAQAVEIQGKPIAEIFTDFHYTFGDTSNTTGFGIKRAFLGYNFLPPGNFSSTVIVNIGSPEELAEGSKSRRYGYFREASITYSREKLDISFGIASTRIFRFQQRFWGKRYIASEYQSIMGYGTVADLGIVLDYSFSDRIKADLSLMNGQGYSNLQLDSHLKSSFGITVIPVSNLAVRLYGDIMKPLDILQTTLVAFTGFKNEKFCIGAEASYKSNIDLTEGHHVWGFSSTGAIEITENTEIFVRYDYSSSVRIAGEDIKWNYHTDRSFVIYGIQHTYNQYVRFALNYQGTYPYDAALNNSKALFLNAHFRF